MLFTLLLPVALAAPIVDPFEESDDSALYREEERIVTVAARYAQTVEDAPAIVTVVTDREIRERGYRTLADVLRALPGVYVSTSEESRSVAWFRGVTSPDNNKILLLVDGAPWFDGVYGHAWLDGYLPLDNVRQIEIIKGPGSAIHGTNAFAGVINVVTYTAEDLKGGFARAVGGTRFRAGVAAVAGVPVRVGDTEAGVSAWARVLQSEGDGLDTTPRGRANVSGSDPERGVGAGFRVQAGGFDGRLSFIDWKHSYFVNEQDDPLDVFTQSLDDFWLSYRDVMAHASYRARVGESILTPRLQWRRYDDPGQYAYFGDPVTVPNDDGTYSTTLDSTLVETFKSTEFLLAGLDAEVRAGPEHLVVAGLGFELARVLRIEDVTYMDGEHEPADGLAYNAPPTDIPTGFGYVQHTWTATSFLETTLGARVDVHGFFGAFMSPRLGVLLVPSDAVVVKLLYGRAFRAPTARELLVEVEADDEGNNLFTSGNPDLEPESIDTVEAEVTARPIDPLRLRAAAFWSSVGGQIDRRLVEDPRPQLGDLFYDNLSGATILGAEAQATATLGAFEIDGSYSLTDARDTGTGNRAYEFPPHMAHLRAGWNAPGFLRTHLSADILGARPRREWAPDSGAEDGPPVALLNLGLATDALAGGRVRIDLSATNLLDTDWSTLVSRDDANAVSDDEPKYPNDLQAEGRMIQVGVEVAF